MLTNSHSSLPNHGSLTPQQQKVVELAAVGLAAEVIAEETGINRETIIHWIESDPNFIWVLNQRQQIMIQAAAARLSTLYSDSLYVLLESFVQIKDDR